MLKAMCEATSFIRMTVDLYREVGKENSVKSKATADANLRLTIHIMKVTHVLLYALAVHIGTHTD